MSAGQRRSQFDHICDFDPACADRDEVTDALRTITQLVGWLEAARIGCKRRLDALASEGRSEGAATAMIETNSRSGVEARATVDRDRVCTDFPRLEPALAYGDVSPSHLDALARLTRGLDDRERSDLLARSDEVVGSALSDYVVEFERSIKAILAEIRSSHREHDEAAELERQRDRARVKRWVDQPTGMHKTLIELDPLRDAILQQAIDRQIARLRQSDSTSEMPFQQLEVEAVLGAVSAGTCATGGNASDPGNVTADISVIIDSASLVEGRHGRTVCETTDGSELPVPTVQRLACEAMLTAVIVDADGGVRRLGRELRLANRSQRRALAAMYRTCAHPHCQVPFSRCRIHHVTWYSQGGPTEVANLLPLCEAHHHLVHEGGWQLSVDADRTLTWVRPDGTEWMRTDTRDRQSTTIDRCPPADTFHQPMLC